MTRRKTDEATGCVSGVVRNYCNRAAGFDFSFYVASVLLPIFLAVVVFSALFNLGAGWYRKYRDVRRVDVFSAKPREKQAPDIIDAEYEIIDDGKK